MPMLPPDQLFDPFDRYGRPGRGRFLGWLPTHPPAAGGERISGHSVPNADGSVTWFDTFLLPDGSIVDRPVGTGAPAWPTPAPVVPATPPMAEGMPLISGVPDVTPPDFDGAHLGERPLQKRERKRRNAQRLRDYQRKMREARERKEEERQSALGADNGTAFRQREEELRRLSEEEQRAIDEKNRADSSTQDGSPPPPPPPRPSRPPSARTDVLPDAPR